MSDDNPDLLTKAINAIDVEGLDIKASSVFGLWLGELTKGVQFDSYWGEELRAIMFALESCGVTIDPARRDKVRGVLSVALDLACQDDFGATERCESNTVGCAGLFGPTDSICTFCLGLGDGQGITQEELDAARINIVRSRDTHPLTDEQRAELEEKGRVKVGDGIVMSVTKKDLFRPSSITDDFRRIASEFGADFEHRVMDSISRIENPPGPC